MKIMKPIALALAGLGAASLVGCGTMSIPHTKPSITKADFGKTPDIFWNLSFLWVVC